MLPLHPASNETPAGPLYRAVWRWLFYAGIIVAPFAIVLAITGAIYLWKPQYEAWRYRELLTAAPGSVTVSVEAQLAAARASVLAPLRAQSFQPAFAPGETSMVTFRRAGGSPFSAGLNVYVDPHTGKVVGQLREETTLMTKVKNLHGALLAGKAGKWIVELIASWALVLFLTGLYLVWPRPRFEVWGSPTGSACCMLHRVLSERLAAPRAARFEHGGLQNWVQGLDLNQRSREAGL